MNMVKNESEHLRITKFPGLYIYEHGELVSEHNL